MSSQQTPEIPALYGAIDSTTQYNGAPVDAAFLRAVALGANRLAAKGHPAFRIFGNSFALGVGGDGGGTGPPPGNLSAYPTPWWQPFCRAKLPVQKMPDLTAYDVRISALIATSGDEVWFQFETHEQPFLSQAQIAAPNLIRCVGTAARAVYPGPANGVPADRGVFDEVTVWVKGLLTNRDQVAGNGGTPITGNVGSLGTEGPAGYMVPASSTWTTDPSVGPTWGTSGSYLELYSNGSLVKAGLQIITVQLLSGGGQWLKYIPALTEQELHIYGSALAPHMTYRIRQLPQIHVYDLVGHLFDRTR